MVWFTNLLVCGLFTSILHMYHFQYAASDFDIYNGYDPPIYLTEFDEGSEETILEGDTLNLTCRVTENYTPEPGHPDPLLTFTINNKLQLPPGVCHCSH